MGEEATEPKNLGVYHSLPFDPQQRRKENKSTKVQKEGGKNISIDLSFLH